MRGYTLPKSYVSRVYRLPVRPNGYEIRILEHTDQMRLATYLKRLQSVFTNTHIRTSYLTHLVRHDSLERSFRNDKFDTRLLVTNLSERFGVETDGFWLSLVHF